MNRKLGKRQQELMDWLHEDSSRYIKNFLNWDTWKGATTKQDEDGNVYEDVPNYRVARLLELGLIEVVFEYNTQQPNTNVMKLKPVKK